MTKNNENFKVGRIMIVDDEAELMGALCETLTKQGYKTQGFTAGADALKELTEQDYDLLLTDLMMPEMDGIALLQAGLDIDPNLVGIIMTGHGTVQTAVEAMRLGAFDYMLKPFKLAAILPLLSRAMEVRHLRMENMQLKETVAIHELGKAIAFSTDLSDILSKVADAAIQQCDADEVSIMLPTRDGKELYVAIVRGGGHSSYIGERVPLDKGIAGWAARNREPVVLNGEVDDQRFFPINPRADIRAAVSMPMLAGGNLVGVLNVNIIQGRRHFTLGQVKALSVLVNIIAPILESTSLYIQMRQAEEKYRSIFENAIEGVYRSTPDGRYIAANPALAVILGYDSPEELMTAITDISHQLYVDPEERTTVMQMIATNGRVEKHEFRFYRKDGSIGWASFNMQAVRDEKGRLLHYDGMAEDISERKRIEKRQALTSKILETLNRPNEIINLIRDILHLLKEHTGIEAIGVRLRDGEDYPYYVTNGFPDHFLEAENSLCAHDEAGEIIRDSQGGPIFECMYGNILCGRVDSSQPFFTGGGSFWTNSATMLMASTTEEERQGRTRNRCNAEGYESLALIPLRSGDEIIGLLQLNDSRRNLLTVEMIQFFERIGLSIGIAVARLQSVETLRESKEELHNSLRRLQETQDMLVQSDKLAAIGTLAAGVTHEILNPLNTISLHLQIWGVEELSHEKLANSIKVCQEQVERIVKISQDLNQFARVGPEETVPGNINHLIEQTFNLIVPKLRLNKVAADLQLRSDLPSIPLDKNRLGQVFLNLVNNAVDAMEAAPQKVLQVSTELVIEAEREFVRVIFADRGTGIPEEAIGKIFDPFFTTKEPGKGTGLGLSIAYRIIQDHGGRVRANNNEWGGASFCIELPVHAPSGSTSSQGSVP
ncbi:MAG TPA: response regulator [Syntrophales bacterium]|nr:response regulator [Syntrophales bacterium]